MQQSIVMMVLLVEEVSSSRYDIVLQGKNVIKLVENAAICIKTVLYRWIKENLQQVLVLETTAAAAQIQVKFFLYNYLPDMNINIIVVAANTIAIPKSNINTPKNIPTPWNSW